MREDFEVRGPNGIEDLTLLVRGSRRSRHYRQAYRSGPANVDPGGRFSCLAVRRPIAISQVTSPTLLSASDVVRELGVDPKAARAALRDAGRKTKDRR